MLKLNDEIPVWFIYGEKSWIDKHGATFVQKNRNNSHVSIKVNLKIKIFFKKFHDKLIR